MRHHFMAAALAAAWAATGPAAAQTADLDQIRKDI